MSQQDPTPKKEYRKPQVRNVTDAPPADDDHAMIILDLALLLLDLKDITRQLEAAILKLSAAERRAQGPNVAPVFRNRHRLTDAERDALEQRAQRKPDDDQYWDTLLSTRG